ncbi:MAG TPA: hypothetical protein PK765_02810 [bacterium]|nr:hypothetical protein [bacterium]
MALDIASLPVDESTREPCETLWIPFYLGYDHYFYANDPEKANRYYKIASAHADAPAGVRTIAATTLSDSGDPTAAMEMLLDLAIFSGESAPACSSVAGTLKRLYSEYFQEGILSYSFIDPVREAKRFIDVYERVRTVESGLCREYILRLERMTQLAHVRQADEAYFRDHDGAHAKDADTLYRIGYLPYEPRDFQQLPDGS